MAAIHTILVFTEMCQSGKFAGPMPLPATLHPGSTSPLPPQKLQMPEHARNKHFKEMKLLMPLQ